MCAQSLLITSEKIAGFDVRVCHRRDWGVHASHSCPCPRNEQEDLRPEVSKHIQNVLELPWPKGQIRFVNCFFLFIYCHTPLQFSFNSGVTEHCGGLGQTPRPRSPASTTSTTEHASPPGFVSNFPRSEDLLFRQESDFSEHDVIEKLRRWYDICKMI